MTGPKMSFENILNHQKPPGDMNIFFWFARRLNNHTNNRKIKTTQE